LDPQQRESFDSNGALHLPGGAAAELAQLRAAMERYPQDRAGLRIVGDVALQALLGPHGPIGSLIAKLCGLPLKPVRAVYFDKGDGNNWSLGWHQDRTIAVQDRVDHPDFGPWTRKQGILHVQPPFPIIAAMRTVRIHLDAVPQDNAPLLIVPGSHRQGLVSEHLVESHVQAGPIAQCLAEAGDIWLYHTAILHASKRSAPGGRRRVLQVDYAGSELPDGMQWLGI
jgi:hypothetical protein